MAYRAALVFLIITITQEACAIAPMLHGGGGGGLSRPGKILQGTWLAFLPVNRNDSGMGLSKHKPLCSHKKNEQVFNYRLQNLTGAVM
jgi:hypothetical protein